MLSYASYDLQPQSKRIPPWKSHRFSVYTHTLHPVLHAHVLEKMTLNSKFFPVPPRMIHCLLSLQLNSTLEYQKVKTTLFSNKLAHLERTRITSLQQNLVLSGAAEKQLSLSF